MEKVKVQAAMAEIKKNLSEEYFNGKRVKSTVTDLPHKLLKKLARAKAYAAESYKPGTIGKSKVATELPRKERRKQDDFTPLYNGNRYKLVRTNEYDENKKKNVTVNTYELIEG